VMGDKCSPPPEGDPQPNTKKPLVEWTAKHYVALSSPRLRPPHLWVSQDLGVVERCAGTGVGQGEASEGSTPSSFG